MKKILFTLILVVFFLQSFVPPASAQTDVVGSVGEFYLNVSGYVSPHASVVLTTEKTFLRSIVADEKGDFSFTEVLIKEGFSGFCLTAVDFHRVGDSHTCFIVPPATASITKENIFLPPTLALSRSSIGPNEAADAFGYTMPRAKVTLFLSSGDKLEVAANEEGFYKFTLKNLPPGKYEIYTIAELNNKESETPSRKKELESYTLGTKITTDTGDFIKKLLTGLFNLLLTYIWIVVPVLILLIILLAKPLRDKLRPFLERIRPGEEGKAWQSDYGHLHHYWFIGY